LNIISIYILDGVCKIPYDLSYQYLIGNSPSSIIVGDFNNDKILDFATANYQDNNISVVLGNGNGTFEKAIKYFSCYRPQSMSSGDFNHDNKLDIVVANENGTSIFLGNEDGTFGTPSKYLMENYLNFVSVGDFNNDNNLDLSVVSFLDFNVSVLWQWRWNFS
jgi:hypothetical protein